MRFRRGNPGSHTSPLSTAELGRPWRAFMIVAAIGLALTGASAWRIHDKAVEESEARLADQGEALAGAVKAELAEVIERLISVGSLYQASDDVSQEEFRRFIANFSSIPGMEGIGYMPIVDSGNLPGFEYEVEKTIPGYFVFELDEEGRRVPVGERSFYVPVQWFEPAAAFDHPHGFDSASERNRLSALLRARTEKRPAFTTFLQLVSEEDDDGFLVYWPITDPQTREVTGFTLAPMDLSTLLDEQASAVIDEDVNWSIEVLTRGRSPQPPPEDTWTTSVDIGSIWWGLSVTRVDDGGFPLLDPAQTTMALVVVIGAAASLLLATLVYQFRKRREAQQELAHLIALTRAKDQFLASVSHELRTPLTGVLGFAELLRDSHEDLTDVERRSMIANVAAEAADLSGIIDDLLVAARSELDLLAITRVQVSLPAQVSQVLETTDPEIRGRVETQGACEQSGLGDPGRVRQIVRNLITNAGRYGGDRIQVRYSGQDGTVTIQVADNGPGVPTIEKERIFEPYYRAHQALGTQPAALGIGLSVARHLARLMDGDLSYRREAGWSVFQLDLPVSESSTTQHADRLEAVPG